MNPNSLHAIGVLVCGLIWDEIMIKCGRTGVLLKIRQEF